MRYISIFFRRLAAMSGMVLLIFSINAGGAQAAETYSQNEILAGDELSGAFFFGLRYGRGELNLKGKGKREIFWQGPSVGFDFGGNASKSFVLIYNLDSADELYGRYPGVDGSFYFVAGVGVNYQRGQKTTLAPIRTGVGLRAGANLGYLNYTKDSSWFPL